MLERRDNLFGAAADGYGRIIGVEREAHIRLFSFGDDGLQNASGGGGFVAEVYNVAYTKAMLQAALSG